MQVGQLPGNVDAVGKGTVGGGSMTEQPNKLVTTHAGGVTLGSADAVCEGTVDGGSMTE